jgi:hypothetical protein
MAAVSLIANAYPTCVNVTLSGTPNTMQELSVGANARRVEIVFTTNAGKIVTAGTDAAVISSEATFPVPADSAWYYDIPRSKGDHSLFVASATGSTVVSCIVTDGD